MRFTDTEQDRPWQKLMREDALRVGQMRAAHLGVKKVVVTRTQTGIRVFRNRCPHAGAPLSGGRLVGEHLICQRHQWEFCLDGGDCPAHPLYQLRQFDTRIEDGWILVQEEEEEIW